MRKMRTLQDVKQQLMQNLGFARQYEALEPEHQIARQPVALHLE